MAILGTKIVHLKTSLKKQKHVLTFARLQDRNKNKDMDHMFDNKSFTFTTGI